MGLLRRVTSLFETTINVMAFLGAALIMFTMLLVNIEVAMRYGVGVSLIYVVEICEYSMVYITFLGAAWLLKMEGHVKMDIVLNRLPPRAQVVANIVTSILGIALCLVLTWYSFLRTWRFILSGYFPPSALRPPLFLVVGIIPIGFFTLFIQFTKQTYGLLKGWKPLKPDQSAESPLI